MCAEEADEQLTLRSALIRVQQRSFRNHGLAIGRKWTQEPITHLLGINLAIHNNPGAPSQLCSRRQVHRDWLPVGSQRLHNQ